MNESSKKIIIITYSTYFISWGLLFQIKNNDQSFIPLSILIKKKSLLFTWLREVMAGELHLTRHACSVTKPIFILRSNVYACI